MTQWYQANIRSRSVKCLNTSIFNQCSQHPITVFTINMPTPTPLAIFKVQCEIYSLNTVLNCLPNTFGADLDIFRNCPPRPPCVMFLLTIAH